MLWGQQQQQQQQQQCGKEKCETEKEGLSSSELENEWGALTKVAATTTTNNNNKQQQQHQIVKNDSWYDSRGFIVVAGVMVKIMISL